MNVDKEQLKKMLCDFIDSSDYILDASFKCDPIENTTYEESLNGWRIYKPSEIKTFNLKVYDKPKEEKPITIYLDGKKISESIDKYLSEKFKSVGI